MSTDIPDLIAGALGVSRGTAYDMMREALAEQPAQQQVPERMKPFVQRHHITSAEFTAFHIGFCCGEEFNKQSVQQQAYEQANPLGGPAKVFQAMANAIRAGDDYHAVLRQYGYAEAQQQEPVAVDVTIDDEDALAVLRDMVVQSNGDLTGIRLLVGHGHWGYGLYVANAEYQEEGALLLTHTSPPASKPWVGLSTDEIYDMYNEPRSDAEMVEFARAIEVKLREKNA